MNDCVINFKLDTGADMNVLPYRYVKHIKNIEMKEYSGPVTAYDGNKLNYMGIAEIVVMCRNEISVQKFLIHEANHCCDWMHASR